MILLLLLACLLPAERLGVTLPASGLEALTEADLQRDTTRLAEASGAERQRRLARRFEEMRLKPAFPEGWRREGLGSCGLRQGRAPEIVLIAASDDGESVSDGAAPVAALISLAKLTDQAEPPPQGRVYCALEGELAALEAALSPVRTLHIGRLHHEGFEVSERGGVTEVRSEGAVAAAEEVDFRALKARVRELHELAER